MVAVLVLVLNLPYDLIWIYKRSKIMKTKAKWKRASTKEEESTNLIVCPTHAHLTQYPYKYIDVVHSWAFPYKTVLKREKLDGSHIQWIDEKGGMLSNDCYEDYFLFLHKKVDWSSFLEDYM